MKLKESTLEIIKTEIGGKFYEMPLAIFRILLNIEGDIAHLRYKLNGDFHPEYPYTRKTPNKGSIFFGRNLVCGDDNRNYEISSGLFCALKGVYRELALLEAEFKQNYDPTLYALKHAGIKKCSRKKVILRSSGRVRLALS